MERFPQDMEIDSIFPALPDDLGRECLMRVPYEWHDLLRNVCKSWKDAVNCPSFYQTRKCFDIWEQCICLVGYSGRVCVYNPLHNTWKKLPPISTPLERPSVSVSLNNKLILMGGYSLEFSYIPSTSVFVYDFCSSTWIAGADMPNGRASFACSVSPEGLVYIAGGVTENTEAEVEAAVYDVEKNKWELLPNMKQPRQRCCGAFLENKFFVISGMLEPAQIYDVTTRTWTFLENLWISTVDRNFVAACERLYLFEDEPTVWEYDLKKNVQILIDFLPPNLLSVEIATVYGENIFVSGYDSTGNTAFYIYCPPTTMEKEKTWISIQGMQSLPDFFYKAATVHI